MMLPRRIGRAAPWRFPRTRRLGVLMLAWLLAALAAEAQTREAFEAARPVLRLDSRDCPLQIHEHGLCLEQAHGGGGSETVRFTAGQGEEVLFAYRLQPLHVISELEASLWVRGRRPGMQLLLRARLPHARMRNGENFLLLPGESYREAGAWRQLHVRDARALLQQQLVKHHAEHSEPLDIRDAYIDAVVVNVFSAPGHDQVWIDDLEVRGEAPLPLERLRELQRTAEAGGQGGGLRVDVDGDQLRIDDQPRLIRAIRLRGEPLALASELGFNAVLLAGPPTPALAEAARQYGLWLIPPPPATREAGPEAAVAAWRETRPDLPPCGRRPRLVSAGVWRSSLDQRRADRDILLVHGDPWDFQTPLSVRGQQWRELIRRVVPQAPAWVVVPTEAPAVLTRHAELLGAEESSAALSTEQIRLGAYQALLAGARGLVFWSENRLDGPHEQARRDSLRLLNAELSRWEPWLAAGALLPLATTADPLDQAGVWNLPRSQWVLVVRHAPDEEHVTGPDNETPLSISLPPQSPSTQAFRLTEPIASQQATLTPLPMTRVPGGVRIRIADSRRIEVVLLSTDQLAVSFAARKSQETSREIVRLRRRLANQLAGATAETHGRLVQLGHELPGADGLLEEARRLLSEARQAEEARRLKASDALVERAADRLTRLRLGHWRAAAAAAETSGATPFLARFETLPQHWKIVDRDALQPWTPVRLGETPWRSSPTPTVWPASWTGPPIAAASGETAWRWLDSPPILGGAGQLLRVRGKLARPAGATRVILTDSATGAELGQELTSSDGRFLLYCVVPPLGQLSLRWSWNDGLPLEFEELELALAPRPANSPTARPPDSAVTASR